MIRQTTRAILSRINGQRAFQTVAEISTYHRIQASTGYRAAAQHAQEKLQRWGIASEVLSFPAREDVIFGTYPSFEEWDCRGAYCDMVSPVYKRLADFDAIPISVIQKSAPCDHTKEPLELVMLDNGLDESGYRNVDFKNKLVFVRGNIDRVYHWLVEQRGAAGLITDFVLQDEHVRERHDQSDTLRYTSFWWKPNQKKAFGFVISPREGDKLAALCEEMKAKKEKILIRCKVDSSIYPGHIEDVMAFLPGKTEEEILLVGHLCHPRSSANDNASGSSCCMEAMLTLKQMLDEGVLPPLQRGIRMLLVPEFTGTYAYLDRIGDKVKNIRAAFNLDMVGGRQDHGYGPITITDLPLSTPSFVSDAAGTVLDEIKRQVVGMMPESYCPLWNSHMTEYSGGSDHVVLSDPKTNVPCLMMGQWPDKYYHTSTDTLDRVDPYILSRSAALAAGYAYGLANLEPADVGDICNTGLQRAGIYLTDLQTKMTRGTLDPRFYKGRVQLYTKWRLDSIDTYASWLDVDRSELEAEKARVTALVRAICGFDPLRPVKTIVTRRQAEKYSLVASRVKNVPVMMNKLQNMFDEKTNAEIDAFCARYMGVLGHAVSLAVDYRIDGRRTTAEIARDIAYEFGVYVPEAIDAYVRMLIKLNYAQEVK